MHLHAYICAGLEIAMAVRHTAMEEEVTSSGILSRNHFGQCHHYVQPLYFLIRHLLGRQ
jgi:hypothetical protein